MKVLVVEDEPVTRLLLVNNLEQWGFDVCEAPNAENAIEQLNKTKDLHLIITDWSLPGKSGIELSQVVHKTIFRPIYILMVTKKSDDKDIVFAIDKGVDDFIAKPFSHGELRVRLRAGERIIKQSLKLRQLADYDSLTNVRNRRSLIESMSVEKQRLQRHGGNSVIALIDVDNFKTINDTFGHKVGDATLLAITKKVESVIRPYDLFGRYGGDEFAIMLPDTSVKSGTCVLERIREEINKLEIESDSSELVKPSLSIGFVADDSDKLSITELLNLADKAMYTSKTKGRNRVEMWLGNTSEKPES